MASSKTVFWEVDAQADFMLPGGKLYVPGAEKIIPNIRRLVDAARNSRVFLVSSACSHTPDDPEFQQFPPHCVRGTDGARIIPEGLTQDFTTIPNDAAPLPSDLFAHRQVVIEKQVLDVFSNPRAAEIVDRIGPSAEFIVFGVVTEYCVGLAAQGLLARGRSVAIVKDAIETLAPDAGTRILTELTSRGARLITTSDALAMLSASSAV
jgi:nicotinamidase/pyrazinamidase